MRLGEYELRSVVGRGGMATVWEATHVPTQSRAAVKVAAVNGGAVDGIEQEFAREVRAVAALVHPSIVSIYDYGAVESGDGSDPDVTPGAPWLAMEWIGGPTARPDSMRSWEQVSSLLVQTLEALAHAHSRGVIHRDVKPDNLLLRDDGRLVLSDFGIAHALTEHVANSSASSGTPLYMAPEQFQGSARDLGPWTDLYALGCVAFHWVSGFPPFDAPTALALAVQHCGAEPAALQPRFEVPSWFGSWVLRLLAKAPSGRFRHAADALWSLRRLQAGGDLGVERPPFPSDWTEPARVATSPIAPGHSLFGLREIPMVDREVERNVLWAALQEVVTSQTPRAVVIRGPAGCGKSRLAQWTIARASELGIAAGMGVYCESGGVGAELGLALASHFRVQDLAKSDARQRFLSTTQILPEQLEPVLTYLAPALREEEPGPRDPRRALALLLREAARERAFIVWVDDIVWSSDALDAVLASLELDAAVLWVLTVRDEDAVARGDEDTRIAAVASHPAGVQLEIEGLAPRDHEALVGSLSRLPASIAEEVARRTDGNPLFAVQLVADWIARQGQAGPSAPITLPHDVASLWLAQVDDVLWDEPDPDGARLALEVAAALGNRVLLREWSDAAHRVGAVVTSGLIERLLRRRLMEPIPQGFRFVHGLLVETLCDVSRRARRWADVNRACAEMLEGDARSWAELARLGRYRAAGDQHEEAAICLSAAAREAIDCERFHEGQVLIRDAERAVAAAKLALRHRAVAELELARIGAARRNSPMTEIYERSRRIAEMAADAGWKDLRAFALECSAAALNGLARFEEAASALFDAADAWEACGQSLRRGRVLSTLCYVLAFAGTPDEAVEVGEEALQILAGDDVAMAKACDRFAYALRYKDERERAEQVYLQGLALAERLAMDELQGHILDGLGSIAQARGQMSEAFALFERAAERFGAAGAQAEAMSRFNCGAVLVELGRAREALEYVEPALEVFESAGVYNFISLGYGTSLQAWALLGDTVAARARWEALEDALREFGFVSEMLAVSLESAAAALVDSDPGLSAELAEAAAHQRAELELTSTSG